MTFAATNQNQKRGKKESKKAEPTAPLVLPAGVMAGKEAILAGKVEQIPLDRIDIRGKHDREAMTDAELKIEELAQSIATAGLQQPIRVVEVGDRYSLVFGERRLRACRMLKHERIAAVVVSSVAPGSETGTSEARAVENIQRVDPSPIGEAVAIADLFEIKYGEIVDEYKRELASKGVDQPDPTVSALAGFRQEAIRRTAERVGKHVTWVRDRMYLAGFSGKARDLVSSGRLPLAHAKEIAKVADPKRRDELAEDYAIGGEQAELMSGESQPGPIESLRGEVAQVCFSLTQVPWNVGTPFDGKPACEECPFNSLNNPGLFEGKALFADDHRSATRAGRNPERPEPKAGVCLKPACYQEKASAASRALSGTVSKVVNKYEAAKAAKSKGADDLIKMSAFRDLVPPFVSPFAVKERVEARIESKSVKKPAKQSSRSSGPVRRPGDYGTPEYEAKRKGEDRYRNAAHNWQDKIANPPFAKYLSAVPGRWAMYALVQRSKPYEKACQWNAKAKDFESRELLAVLQLVEKPSFEAVLKIQEYCGTKFGLLETSHCGRPNQHFMHAIVKAMGIEIPAPPDEATFVKEELAKFKVAQENKANIAKANGRGGKSASKKAKKQLNRVDGYDTGEDADE